MAYDAQILIVDDQPENRLILEDFLSPKYRVHQAGNGAQALEMLNQGLVVDLVLLDILMPELDGFATCQAILAMPGFENLPILFLTGLDSVQDEEKSLSLGAVDFIRKPFSGAVVKARIRTHLELARARQLLARRNQGLELLVAERTREIEARTQELLQSKRDLIHAQEAILGALCALVESRDQNISQHIQRTQRYLKILALQLRKQPAYAGQLDAATVDCMSKASALHDIGKISIPDSILLKTSVLDASEWGVMQRHCEFGSQVIQAVMQSLTTGGRSFLECAEEIARCHHERWDGCGYPAGLNGTEIPLSARLMAVVDVYDTITSDRPYKLAQAHEEAVDWIRAGRNSQFDPDLVDAFESVQEVFRQIALNFSDPA